MGKKSLIYAASTSNTHAAGGGAHQAQVARRWAVLCRSRCLQSRTHLLVLAQWRSTRAAMPAVSCCSRCCVQATSRSAASTSSRGPQCTQKTCYKRFVCLSNLRGLLFRFSTVIVERFPCIHMRLPLHLVVCATSSHLRAWVEQPFRRRLTRSSVESSQITGM